MTPSIAIRTPLPAPPAEGITVTGEAVRRVAPESAEFLIEITASAGSAAHALHEVHGRTGQVADALTHIGVQRADIQSISLNVQNVYSPQVPRLPVYSPVAQIAPGGMAYGAATAMQPEPQFGMYYAHNILRITVRDAAHAGDAADLCTKAGAIVIGGFAFHAADEAAARRAVLEAAGKDAQTRAEGLAAAAGKRVGEPIGITEDVVVSNGMIAALRTAVPWALGASAPTAGGELEYYARVTACFRWQ
ncbi:MAG TPA: SIMPL domain-containing protein [Verrucomicrobiae bacterium]|nr:SIMPL domain-containing protein [Verrucomicrobiae bacterium]